MQSVEIKRNLIYREIEPVPWNKSYAHFPINQMNSARVRLTTAQNLVAAVQKNYCNIKKLHLKSYFSKLGKTLHLTHFYDLKYCDMKVHYKDLYLAYN